jgi:hypothetical protein
MNRKSKQTSLKQSGALSQRRNSQQRRKKLVDNLSVRTQV